jgi:hypothetical protein
MRENSLAAYHTEEPKLSTRAAAIVEWLEAHGPATDRQIMQGMGFRDMNAVRPRVTELLGPPTAKLMEVGDVVDETTNRRVRRVDIRRARQAGLFS